MGDQFMRNAAQHFHQEKEEFMLGDHGNGVKLLQSKVASGFIEFVAGFLRDRLYTLLRFRAHERAVAQRAGYRNRGHSGQFRDIGHGPRPGERKFFASHAPFQPGSARIVPRAENRHFDP